MSDSESFNSKLHLSGFFHAILNERSKYGILGGWSLPCVFTSQDLQLGVHYMEVGIVLGLVDF